MSWLLRRDLLLSRDRGWAWSLGVVFFIAYSSLLVLGLPQGRSLTALGPGVIWSGVVYGLLLTAPSTFASDIETGAIDHLRLRGHSLGTIVFARALSTSLISMLPLLPTAAVVALLYTVDAGTTARLLLGLLIAAPALAAYTVFIGIIVTGRRAAGLVGIVIAIPLLAPLVIFGIASATTAAASLWTSVEFLALAGASLIGSVIGLSGAVAALKVNVE